MESFGSVKECPKCGRKIAFAYTDVTWEDRIFIGYSSSVIEVHSEHMIRTCRCGYSWREKPKDAE